MEHYVIYKNPNDFPGKFVVRLWTVGPEGLKPAEQPHAVTLSLEAARMALPDGLTRIPRLPDDDPPIVEVWA